MKYKQLIISSFGIVVVCLSPGADACKDSIVRTKPDSIYIDHLDGTVSDIETGLMWQKCTIGKVWNPGIDLTIGSDDRCEGYAENISWQEALAIASEDTSHNYSDWRLPNINELKSIVEKACYENLNAIVFPHSMNSSYWSSSPYADDDVVAWTVSFVNGGFAKPRSKTAFTYARLVRGGQ